MASIYDIQGIDNAWCPGCGNHAILGVLKSALDELKISPENLLMVSGIGQAAKLPQYMKGSYFNGLHGRALPAAVAAKASNIGLTVIAESGDGDMYGEGGNHFLATIRRNPDITNIVHNNMIYGLTKGQASPTSSEGIKTNIQVDGVFEHPFNPLAVAIAMNASFVARAFSGDLEQTKEILKQAIQHKGYALVDLLHPCVSFNKFNTFQWFKDNTYYIENHDISDRNAAFALAIKEGKLGLGIYYKNDGRAVFEEQLESNKADKTPLYKRSADRNAKLDKLIKSYI
ncbi:MAG: thiamine pyrophosphate-dependent enzyme [Endomicrobia bacterium]|nr:thiamine pyrophosphate-dependent enzyme [Endomicrobiia bacterium]MCL2506971.1 thiamine pyrophosphate-dependent enzyme [Endomicrobiia bacterium]